MDDRTGATPAPPPTASSASSATGSAVAPPLSFDGRRKPLIGLLIRNLLLMIVTIGIYRFWAVTRVRRFFWRGTRLAGDAFEYLGTGAELFVGFLIAIAVLAPLAGLYSLTQIFLTGTGGGWAIALDVAYYTLILFLIQIAIHRMRRYRLTRTAWRGVRFGVDGSSLRYALISFGYALLTFATLGLAAPWWTVATYRYFARHARFGGQSFALDAAGARLFGPSLAVTIPSGLAVALFALLNYSLFAEYLDLAARAQEGAEVQERLLAVMASISYWPLALLAISFFTRIWYRVYEFRYLVGGLSLGTVRLASSIRFRSVFGIYLGYYAMIAAVVVLLALLSFGLVGVDTPQQMTLAGPLFTAGLFVVFFFVYPVLRIAWLQVALLRLACRTTAIANTAALADIAQSSADLPSHGEGLADALDVGGF